MPYRYTTDVPGWQHDMMRNRTNSAEKALGQNYSKQKTIVSLYVLLLTFWFIL